MRKTSWTFTTGYAGAFDDEVYLAAAADALPPDARYTTLYTWSPELAKIEGFDSPWIYRSQNWVVTAVTGFFPKDSEDWWYCALSEEGQVLFTGGGHSEESIPQAGVNRPDAAGWGHLSDIQQIGDHLYACGFSGQVYKRWGPGDWRHMDAGLLQAPATALGRSIGLTAINGAAEDAIYAAGYLHAEGLPAKAFFYNGAHWRELSLPAQAGRITNLYVASPERIWMCGAKGLLLVGNAQDGFEQVAAPSDLLLTSITEFQGRLVMASDQGLFSCDANQPEAGLQAVRTQLTPELQNTHVVDRCKQVLWSIGPKDIACFDGKSWTRLHHPDNPRIGEA